MRYLHRDFEALRQWLVANGATIRRLEWDRNPVAGGFAVLPWTLKRRPAHPPQPATVAEIEATFARAADAESAGTILSHYFHVNAPPSDVAVSLAGAVEHVEAFGSPEEFLIVGHPDGGLVSVSRWPLPFHVGVQEAQGWGP